jgi:hypothetical protein
MTDSGESEVKKNLEVVTDGASVHFRHEMEKLLAQYKAKVLESLGAYLESQGATAWPLCHMWGALVEEEVTVSLRPGLPPPDALRPTFLQGFDLEIAVKLPGVLRKVPKQYVDRGAPAYVRTKDSRVIPPADWEKIVQLNAGANNVEESRPVAI